jgi:energy-converting hydrogenase Eha subunit C
MKFLILTLLIITNAAMAQERYLDVAINSTQYYAKDTIAISIDYVDDYNAKAEVHCM